MMKKRYTSPEVELISLNVFDVLTASRYVPDPEIGSRTGDDEFEGGL